MAPPVFPFLVLAVVLVIVALVLIVLIVLLLPLVVSALFGGLRKIVAVFFLPSFSRLFIRLVFRGGSEVHCWKITRIDSIDPFFGFALRCAARVEKATTICPIVVLRCHFDLLNLFLR